MDPSTPSDGAQAGVISRYLGAEFMPWQTEAARVALARRPDGRYKFRTVVITVPRQSGKTTLLRAIGMQKMLARADQSVFYTAQTGKDAGERWRDLVKAIERSPLQDRVQVLRGAGNMQVILPNRSTFRAFAPTVESLHGYTPHNVMLDEAFAYSEDLGEALMGAIVPAMSTIIDGQLYIVSTAGTAESKFLHDWIAAGQAGQDGVALIDYGAPAGVDFTNPEAWWEHHPALGYTIGGAAIADALDKMPFAEFERAYANRRTMTASYLIPLETWTPLKAEIEADPADDLAITYDVAFDGSAASIVATYAPSSSRWAGSHHQVILERHAGTDWLVPAILKHRDELSPRSIGADNGGATPGYTEELRRRGVVVDELMGRELATGYSRWLKRIETAQMTHDGTDEFWRSVAAIATRPMSDAVAPSRRHSAGDISVAVAAIVGTLLLERLEAPAPKPLIYFAS